MGENIQATYDEDPGNDAAVDHEATDEGGVEAVPVGVQPDVTIHDKMPFSEAAIPPQLGLVALQRTMPHIRR